jgi:hypothetical protein
LRKERLGRVVEPVRRQTESVRHDTRCRAHGLRLGEPRIDVLRRRPSLEGQAHHRAAHDVELRAYLQATEFGIESRERGFDLVFGQKVHDK